jgi:hypothetical protein
MELEAAMIFQPMNRASKEKDLDPDCREWHPVTCPVEARVVGRHGLYRIMLRIGTRREYESTAETPIVCVAEARRRLASLTRQHPAGPVVSPVTGGP